MEKRLWRRGTVSANLGGFERRESKEDERSKQARDRQPSSHLARSRGALHKSKLPSLCAALNLDYTLFLLNR